MYWDQFSWVFDMINEISAGIMTYWSLASLPSGWLECNGQAISRTSYAKLFAVIGQTFGNGDGSSTFNLPDFRGRCIVGVGQGSGLTNRLLAQTGGEESHAVTTSEMPSHAHDLGNHTHDMSHAHNWVHNTGGAAGSKGINSTTTNLAHSTVTTTGPTPNATGAPSTNTTDSAGSGTAHANIQPYLVLRVLIKT